MLLISFYTKAQQNLSLPKLDDKAIVRDEAGNIVPTILWRAYSRTGDYSFKFNKDKTEFIIYEMTAEQKIVAEERKKLALQKLPRPSLSSSFKDGEKFRGDRFTDINGVKYDLRELTGKVLVFNFWFINCPPCRQEIPDLNKFKAKYKENKDVIFLAIASDEKFEIKEFIKKLPFAYNIVATGSYYEQKYNVNSFPTHLIIGKDGLVKFHSTGFASNTIHWLEKSVDEQLAISATNASP